MALGPLDLRGKTMSELAEMDRSIGSQLSALDLLMPFMESGFTESKSDIASNLLADRRQIRAAIAALKGA